MIHFCGYACVQDEMKNWKMFDFKETLTSLGSVNFSSNSKYDLSSQLFYAQQFICNTKTVENNNEKYT